MKILPTEYRDVRFRSRLEARWAVYFDHVGIMWEYEPEGFELPAGCYLPDFWFPDLRRYGEVKPVPLTPHELTLACQLADATKCEVLLLEGLPSTREVVAVGPYEFHKGDLEVPLSRYELSGEFQFTFENPTEHGRKKNGLWLVRYHTYEDDDFFVAGQDLDDPVVTVPEVFERRDWFPCGKDAVAAVKHKRFVKVTTPARSGREP